MTDFFRQPRRVLRALRRLVTDPAYRGEWRARLKPARGAFQPFGATRPDRYPVIFRRAAQLLPAGARLLSFGCSTGEEAFALRTYFPNADIKGVDINPANIAVAARRLARAPDPRIVFAVADSTAQETDASYDAIFCMAVLRHGDLTRPDVERCDPLLDFADFARATADFARCLKPGGLLVLRHSNFRFADAPASAGFEVAARVPVRGALTPLFGPDNRRLPGAVYDETIFRKRAS